MMNDLYINKTGFIEKRDRQDKEADYFARCILMPEQILRNEIIKLKEKDLHINTDEFIQILSKKFRVPEYQMTIRLIDLKILS